jgi:hypothetical protein
VAALQTYGDAEQGSPAIALSQINRIIAIGSDSMMAAVAEARRNVLARHLKPGHVAVGSINSPMQSMMKEICAQCPQRQVDPIPALRPSYSPAPIRIVLDTVDFAQLRARLSQNSVQEKVTGSGLIAQRRAGWKGVAPELSGSGRATIVF